MRRLENEDEEKFWEAWIKDDLIFCYRYGKIGSSGHLKIKKFATRPEAEAELEDKLKEKLREGFSEPGAPETEEEEDEESSDSESSSSPSSGEKKESEEEESEEEEESSSSSSGEKKEEEESEDEEESEEEAESEEEESEEEEESDDEEESEEEESEDEDEEDEKPKRATKKAPAPVAAAKPPPEPEKPKLPTRIHPRTPTRDDLTKAKTALEALAKSAGGRSWHVARRAKAAGRAVEKLGGGDPGAFAETSKAWSEVLALVMAPAKALPLHAALRLLWAVDAAVIGKTVGVWRAKMLSTTASATVGILASTFDAVPDAEVAAQTSAALVDRVLPREGFKRRFFKVRPFLEESLKTKGTTVAKFLAALRPEKDALLQRRLADAKDVGKEAP
jgi:predicted DNA-binding WGR domain protein